MDNADANENEVRVRAEFRKNEGRPGPGPQVRENMFSKEKQSKKKTFDLDLKLLVGNDERSRILVYRKKKDASMAKLIDQPVSKQWQVPCREWWNGF